MQLLAFMNNFTINIFIQLFIDLYVLFITEINAGVSMQLICSTNVFKAFFLLLYPEFGVQLHVLPAFLRIWIGKLEMKHYC